MRQCSHGECGASRCRKNRRNKMNPNDKQSTNGRITTLEMAVKELFEVIKTINMTNKLRLVALESKIEELKEK
jgi:BMFP domain-containing protein YqiC